MKKLICLVLCLALCSVSLFSQESKSRGLGIKKASDNAKQTVESQVDSSSVLGIPTIELEESQICNVYSLDFSPDGQYIVAGYNDSSVKVWNAQTGRQTVTLVDKSLKTQTAHTETVWAVAFSNDGKYIASGSADKTVKIWDASSGNLLHTLKGHSKIVSFVTFSADDVNIASGSSDGSIKLWDVQTGFELQEMKGHTKTIAAISYSDSKRLMGSASWDGTAKIYFAQGGKELFTLKGHQSEVFAIDFSKDEKFVATGSADRTVKLWNTSDGSEVKTSKKFAAEIWDLNFSKDGRFLVACDSSGGVKILNATTLEILRELEGHKASVRSVGFSADSKYMASGDSGGLIKIWDTETWELLATFLQCKNAGWVTWTPEGFLVGSDDAISKLSYTVDGQKYQLAEIKDSVVNEKMVQTILSKQDPEEKSFLDLLMEQKTPSVAFKITNADGTKRTDDSQRDISLAINLTNAGSGIGRVYVKLNGRLIQLTEKLECDVNSGVLFYSPTPISLRNGDNTISIVAYNAKNTNSSTSSAENVRWEGAAQKGRLFILAAGINNYKDKTVPNLTNCVKDAEGIVEAAKMYAGDLYTEIYAKVMRDTEVTKENLIQEINNFGANILPDDVFIFYVAGHGITHSDGDYYFIPQNFVFKNEQSVPQNGLSKWEMIQALSSIQAENMTVILDTCNSASFHSTKQEFTAEDIAMNKSAVIDRFAAQAGYDLIAACSSTQVALDDYEGHGLFTHCIIDAIKGAADLDLNGQITSAEFATYVIKEVPILGAEKYGYKQEPQRSQPLFDYPMFGKLNPDDGKSLEETLAIARLMREEGLTKEQAEAKLLATAQESGVTVQVAAAEVVNKEVTVENSVLPVETVPKQKAKQPSEKKLANKAKQEDKKKELIEQVGEKNFSNYSMRHFDIKTGAVITGYKFFWRSNGDVLIGFEYATNSLCIFDLFLLQPVFAIDLKPFNSGVDFKMGANCFPIPNIPISAGIDLGLLVENSSYSDNKKSGFLAGINVGWYFHKGLKLNYNANIRFLDSICIAEDQLFVSYSVLF